MKDKINVLIDKYTEELNDYPSNAEEKDYNSGFNDGSRELISGILSDLNMLQRDLRTHKEILLEENGVVLAKWKGEFVTWLRATDDLTGEGFVLGHYFLDLDSAKADYDKRLADSRRG